MKRCLMVLSLMCLMLTALAFPVRAESTATKIDTFCTIDAEGNCLVNMTVTLRLEGSNDSLTFPLPRNATGITLNKASVRTQKTDSAVEVDISRVVSGLTGEFSMQFDYAIPKIVKVYEDETLKEKLTEEKKLILELPLLCGFSFPVERLAYTINLPGAITEPPRFSSVYRKESIESIMPFTVSGNMIIGESTAQLNDHEGVTMTMIVPEQMFPNVSTGRRCP